MSELVFERGLFATLAAALIVPELTTFLIFVFVVLSLSSLVARQAWSFVRVPLAVRSAPGRAASERATLRVVAVDGSGPSVQ
ncbi:MAG TPA: hypothetical protein VEI07_13945 [Planctomycetaceae bacterium]|nr:hypothetical protein [Planctomycetaceae bacterium]